MFYERAFLYIIVILSPFASFVTSSGSRKGKETATSNTAGNGLTDAERATIGTMVQMRYSPESIRRAFDHIPAQSLNDAIMSAQRTATVSIREPTGSIQMPSLHDVSRSVPPSPAAIPAAMPSLSISQMPSSEWIAGFSVLDHPSQGHHLPSSVARASTNITNFIPNMGAPFLKLSDKQISQIIQSTNAPAHQPAGTTNDGAERQSAAASNPGKRGGKRRWTNTDYNTILSLRNEGLTPAQINHLTGMPEGTLAWHMSKNKIEGRSSRRFTSQEEKDKIKEMVDANKQYSQIQNEMNQINEHTLHRIYLNYKKSNEKEKQKSKDETFRNLMSERSALISSINRLDGLVAENGDARVMDKRRWTYLKNKHMKQLKDVDTALATATSSQVAPSVTRRSPDPTTAQVQIPYPVPQTPGTPSTYSMSALFDAASPGTPSTYSMSALFDAASPSQVEQEELLDAGAHTVASAAGMTASSFSIQQMPSAQIQSILDGLQHDDDLMDDAISQLPQQIASGSQLVASSTANSSHILLPSMAQHSAHGSAQMIPPPSRVPATPQTPSMTQSQTPPSVLASTQLDGPIATSFRRHMLARRDKSSSRANAPSTSARLTVPPSSGHLAQRPSYGQPSTVVAPSVPPSFGQQTVHSDRDEPFDHMELVAGWSNRFNAPSSSRSDAMQQLPFGQSIQIDHAQIHHLPSVSLHGTYPNQTAGANLHSGMMPTTGVIAPSSNIIVVDPSERWRNANPSVQIRGTQPSAGQPSNFRQPSNQVSQHGSYHNQPADETLQYAGAYQSTIRAPSAEHRNRGTSGQTGRTPPSEGQ